MFQKGSYVLLVLLFFLCCLNPAAQADSSFGGTTGTRFVMNGKPFYINGFNAYWMMYMASDPSTQLMVTSAFQQASKYKMNVARTWGFSDGGDRPLQISPGSYNENKFKVSLSVYFL